MIPGLIQRLRRRLIAGLVDTATGGWRWSDVINYGLVDNGTGGWVWTSKPIYGLNTSSKKWERI